MAISTNSIIHYTNDFEILKSILSNGFRISYCSEKVITRGAKNYAFAIAMVSFCDIPISDYKKHFYKQKGNNLGYYGDYGIGISKDWAVKKGLNPVLYVDTNSYVGTALRKSVELYTKPEENKFIKSHSKDNQELNELTQFALYAKNYQGELNRKGKIEQRRYRFYDEREWRFVAQAKDINNHEIILEEPEYLNNKENHKNNLIDCFLKFSLQDISYIIVKEESEIMPMVIFLRDLVSGMNNLDKGDIILSVLLTKIISSEQILSDF